MRKTHRKSSGFTLIELLVVLVILGGLAGLVGPRVMKYLGESKSKTAALQIEDFGAALDLFRLDNGRYPRADEGLVALVSAPAGLGSWAGPYLKKPQLPSDPWGQPYQYSFPGEHGEYDIVTLGADGQPGGDGENRDVSSWN
jgi:general secretion pathway protein G